MVLQVDIEIEPTKERAKDLCLLVAALSIRLLRKENQIYFGYLLCRMYICGHHMISAGF
jgi:hypothetical protein